MLGADVAVAVAARRQGRFFQQLLAGETERYLSQSGGRHRVVLNRLLELKLIEAYLGQNRRADAAALLGQAVEDVAGTDALVA